MVYIKNEDNRDISINNNVDFYIYIYALKFQLVYLNNMFRKDSLCS